MSEATMSEADDAGAQVGVSQEETAPDGDGAFGGGEPFSVGGDGPGLADLLAGEPSDTVPVAYGTYSLYHATNGGVVLVLDDSRAGVKTLAIPKAMLALMGTGGRPSWKSLPKLLGGRRG